MKNISVHIFIGEDDKLVKSEINKLENSFSQDYEKEFYFADDTPANEILALTDTLALFGNKKLIKVYSFEKYLKEFVAYIDQSSPPNNMILVSFSNPKDLLKKLNPVTGKEYIKIYTFGRVKSPAKSLISKLEQIGVILHPKAKQYILENFNTAGDVDEFISLFSSFPEAKAPGLTLEHVYPHLSGDTNFFAFMDSLFARDLYQTLIEFEKLISIGEDLIGMLYRIHSHLKNIWQARYLSGNHAGKGEIMRQLKCPAFLVDKYLSQCSKFGFSKMAELISEIHNMDVNLKSKDKKLHKVLFEKMLMKFC